MGDGLAMAVHMQSPTGWAPLNNPPSNRLWWFINFDSCKRITKDNYLMITHV